MNRIEIRSVAELWPQVERVLTVQLPRLQQLASAVPAEHIGATAIPGTLTKGDVDVVLRTRPEQFAPTVAALRTGYAVAQPQNWTADFASFKDDTTGPLPFGVQVVVIGSDTDHLVTLRDLLRRDPIARERYNGVKRRHHGSDPETYWQAKDRLIAELLATIKPPD